MHKKTVILFAILIFVSQIGYYFAYTLAQWHLKEQVKEKLLTELPESSLEIIEQDATIRWKEAGKEFYRGDDLYDIVYIRKQNDKTFLYCLNDKKEKSLLKKLILAIQSGIDGRSHPSAHKHTVKFPPSDFTPRHIPVKQSAIDLDSKKYFPFSEDIVTQYKKIQVPPPRA